MVCMDKKPSEKAETMARELQSKLQHERPRWLRWVPLLAIGFLGLLVLLVWILYPPPHPPRLVVTALDGLGQESEPPPARAWLDPQDPDEAPRSLEGHPVLFGIEADGAIGTEAQQRAQATRSGLASAPLPFRQPKTLFHVRLLDPAKKYEREDRARAFLLSADAPLLLVDVEETLADVDVAAWGKTNAQNIAVRAGAIDALQAAHAQQKYAVVYLAVNGSPAKEYRRVRGWVMMKAAGSPPALPDGPVLGRLAYDASSVTEARRALLSELRQRFTGPMVAVVRTSEAAEQCVQLRIRAFAMGGGDFPPLVTPLKSWPELPVALSK